jgi:hypothetical protein
MHRAFKRNFFVTIIAAFSLFTCSQRNEWTTLLNNKDLSGWDTYLGPAYDTINHDWSKNSIGLNQDPLQVFSIVAEDGQPALRISGAHFGGISTLGEYANFHLRLEFKWGKEKHHPKKNSKRDSGLLYHAVGDHGADSGFWMRSQEFQIQEGDCGDYWGVAGGSFEVPSILRDSGEYVFDQKGTLIRFHEKSPNGRRCIKNPDAEKPYGEWNVVELYCFGDTAVHVMNGQVVMVLYHSGQLANDNVVPLVKGKIQIQSEGAEIFYRNIQVKNIKQLPEGLIK